MVGDRLFQGKDNLAEALEQMQKDQTVVLAIHHIASHGKAGAVNGETKLKSGKTHAFCNVYEFNAAKAASVKEITSYVIEIK